MKRAARNLTTLRILQKKKKNKATPPKKKTNKSKTSRGKNRPTRHLRQPFPPHPAQGWTVEGSLGCVRVVLFFLLTPPFPPSFAIACGFRQSALLTQRREGRGKGEGGVECRGSGVGKGENPCYTLLLTLCLPRKCKKTKTNIAGCASLLRTDLICCSATLSVSPRPSTNQAK